MMMSSFSFDPDDPRPFEDQLREAGMVYLSRLPRAAEDVPPGWVVVHNDIVPTRELGLRGFRTWLQDPDVKPRLEPCECDWAPELGVDYRVIRPQDVEGEQEL